MQKFLYFVYALLINHVVGEFTANDCRELGFIKGQLLCSSCEKLDDFGLEDIKTHCHECCIQDELPAAQRRYPKAVLEVCTCKFRAYPQIQAFIQSTRPSKFPNLTIKYVRGLDPIIKLIDKSGTVQETLSIAKWNTDTVEEFFETHLDKACSVDGKQPCSKQSSSVIEEEEEDLDFFKTNLI